ncbi:hypothetical protein K435DRAFT_876979 [Dendrothele bispora CBS 962.96]|uniref:Nucleotide-diphospho-sugar transferase domain-containing protein n=1 Tax=Dendrothele bispora (strain CBS 962.96) TaxID=1314807 RepID=A0A4S8KR55_DENBC|nr:hypothetical protein K435DRAFT_876979 [Dendrothele bispora CBS 962.96]
MRLLLISILRLINIRQRHPSPRAFRSMNKHRHTSHPALFSSRVSSNSVCITKTAGIRARLRGQYTELRIRSLGKELGIDSASYFDTDVLVLRNFEELLNIPWEFGVTPDVYRPGDDKELRDGGEVERGDGGDTSFCDQTVLGQLGIECRSGRSTMKGRQISAVSIGKKSVGGGGLSGSRRRREKMLFAHVIYDGMDTLLTNSSPSQLSGCYTPATSNTLLLARFDYSISPWSTTTSSSLVLTTPKSISPSARAIISTPTSLVGARTITPNKLVSAWASSDAWGGDLEDVEVPCAPSSSFANPAYSFNLKQYLDLDSDHTKQTIEDALALAFKVETVTGDQLTVAKETKWSRWTCSR